MTRAHASLAALALGLAAVVAPAIAQSPPGVTVQSMPPVLPPPGATAAVPGERTIEVTVNYSLNIPIKAESAQQQAEALETARRSLYQIAAGECKVLLATIATSCHIQRLNVQSNVQRQMPGMEMIHVAGNGAYRITLK